MTKTNRKLEHFSAALQQRLEIEKLRAKTETTRNLRTTEKLALENATYQAKMSFETAKQTLTQNANKQISRAKIERITRYVTIKKQQTDQLLTLARAKLASFTLSAGYEKHLLSLIQAAYNPHFHIIKLSPQDMRFEKNISSTMPLTVQAGDRDIIGGFILLDEHNTIMADHSFETRLANVLKNFNYCSNHENS